MKFFISKVFISKSKCYICNPDFVKREGKREKDSYKSIMAKVCQITGKRTAVGNNVSHANNKTKRKFFPNLQTKRFFIPEENRWVMLKVSTQVIRTISKKGIHAVIKESQERGLFTGKI
ncbi:MAG: hypothetical protein RL711_728 [Bacteroidota bacterium]